MAELLQSLRHMLSSCREKARYHEWRQLLPHIHGETNSVCESMSLVIESMLCCSKVDSCSASELASYDVPDVTVLKSTFGKLNHASIVHSREDAIALAVDLFKVLLHTIQEVEDINQRMLARYLMKSDGLPLTSLARIDPDVVQALRQCLSAMSHKLKTVDVNLERLCEFCDFWYNSKTATSAFRCWQANYDNIREDIQEAHAAIDRCTRYIDDARNLLCQETESKPIANSKRVRALSPLYHCKMLKRD